MNDEPIRILLVEDNETDAWFVRDTLESSTAFHFELAHVTRLTNAMDTLSEADFDVVLLDLFLPDEQGMTTFTRLNNACADIPILVMSGLNDEKVAVEAVNKGAQDYLVKGTVDANLLIRSIKYAIERKNFGKMLLQAAREWRSTFNALEDAIVLTDTEGRILRCNEAARDLFGKPFPDIIGRPLWDFLQRYTDAIEKNFGEMRNTGRRANMVLEVEDRWFSMNLDPIHNEKGEFTGSACIFSDITRQKQTEESLHVIHEELKNLATTDRLTGAFNRSKFEEIIKLEIERAKRYGDSLSLIMFDIDNFKAINDNYGHMTGDNVLGAIGDSIRNSIRKTDYFVRWGGEEFMIVSSEMPVDRAYALAERLRKMIEEYKFEGAEKVTVSFGVTEFKVSDDEDGFIRRADEALYNAKNKGKNRVETA